MLSRVIPIVVEVSLVWRSIIWLSYSCLSRKPLPSLLCVCSSLGFLSFISEISAWRLVFWNSIHLEDGFLVSRQLISYFVLQFPRKRIPKKIHSFTYLWTFSFNNMLERQRIVKKSIETGVTDHWVVINKENDHFPGLIFMN